MSEVPPSYKTSMELAEEQLQQELRAMFEVDSQEYLQTYVTLVQQMQPLSWKADIQELYRSIHTIKGMAVTVEADAVVQVATALEDLLSDLRYQAAAPDLRGGELISLLEESGELLTAALQVELVGDAAREAVYPSTARLQAIRKYIKQVYLPDTNEKTQLYYEFAEQGFDLVVLELEINLEQLPPSGPVPASAIETAQQTLQQLQQIGRDLEFDVGWGQLLEMGTDLINRSDTQLWQETWLPYLQVLKDSARQGGQLLTGSDAFVTLQQRCLSVEAQSTLGHCSPVSPEVDLDFIVDLDNFLLDEEEDSVALDLDLSCVSQEAISSEFIPVKLESIMLGDEDVLDQGAIAEPSPIVDIPFDANPQTTAIAVETVELGDFFADFEVEDAISADLSDLIADSAIDNGTSTAWEALATQETSILEPRLDTEEDWDVSADFDPTISLQEQPTVPPGKVTETESPLSVPAIEDSAAKIQIPVSLQRLDRASQTLVETLLAARASQGFYQNLQSQLVQLVSLAQDSVEYITRLRQIQDEYALLSGTTSETDLSSRPTLERYRQGYSIINRLLETSLRLTEVGAEVSTSARQTANSLQQLDRNILSLQKNVEESRLISFKTLSFRAKGIVRELSTRFKKAATLTVQGANLEIDAGIAQALEPVLLHLIRNAYDHGLETPEERTALGKSPQGAIHLSLRRQGSSYYLSIQDDGRGIDPVVIRQLAEAKRLPLTCTDTPAELLAVLCQSGFSSRETITDVSGRGVGMDVVASQVAQLGGRLKLETTPGVGSTFQLQIPLPQLLIRCILVRSGDLVFAIPREEIVTTALWSSLSTKPVSDPNCAYSCLIQDRVQSLPGLDLLTYWQGISLDRTFADTTVCIRVRSLELTEQNQDIWLLADDLLEQVDLVIKTLPYPLVPPLGLTGLSMQADGRTIPVLDPSALATQILTVSRPKPVIAPQAVAIAPTAPEPIPISSPRASTILVVDDAALVRRRLEASLSNYGYQVQACRDGLEAWTWLQNHPSPDLLITDIEMPNMDGFTLIDRARQAGMNYPMVVISSRLSEEWSKEAKRLGATDYLTKGFSTAELLSKVQSLLTMGLVLGR